MAWNNIIFKLFLFENINFYFLLKNYKKKCYNIWESNKTVTN